MVLFLLLQDDPLGNLNLALEIAEKHLDIPKMLDPEGALPWKPMHAIFQKTPHFQNQGLVTLGNWNYGMSCLQIQVQCAGLTPEQTLAFNLPNKSFCNYYI